MPDEQHKFCQQDLDHNWAHQFRDVAKSGALANADLDLAHLAEFTLDRNGGTVWHHVDRLCQTAALQRIFEWSTSWIMSLQKDADRNELKYLHQFVDLRDKRVLEIGCGEGRLTWQYAKAAHSVTAVDLDHDALRVAKVDRPSDLEDKVYLACADSEYLPFTKEKFDIAVLAWSL